MKIAFYKGTRPFPQGLFNIAVRWWTGGIYSHCELVVCHVDPDSPSLCVSSSFIDGGVRKKWINLDSQHWDIIEVAPMGKHDPVVWFSDHLGQKYDTINLLGFIWRRKDGSKKKWTCSEACAAALGLQEPWRYDPNSLYAVIKSMEGL